MDKINLTDINIRFVDDEKNCTNALFTCRYSNGQAYIESQSLEKPFFLCSSDNDIEICLKMYGRKMVVHKPLFLNEKKRKMTIEEIENKLGYNIEIVSKK